MDIVERVARALCRERMQHSNEIFRKFEPHRYKTQEVLERMIEDSWWFEVEQAKAALAASGVAELVEALELTARSLEVEFGVSRAEVNFPQIYTALARYRGEA